MVCSPVLARGYRDLGRWVQTALGSVPKMGEQKDGESPPGITTGITVVDTVTLGEGAAGSTDACTWYLARVKCLEHGVVRVPPPLTRFSVIDRE